MQTPPTTILPPYSPATPVLVTVSTEHESPITVLHLPSAVGSTQNHLLPTPTAPLSQPFSTTNLQHPQPLYPVCTLASDVPHFPMTAAFQTREFIAAPCPTRHPTLLDRIRVPHSAQHSTSSPQPPASSHDLSVVPAQLFTPPSEAGQ